MSASIVQSGLLQIRPPWALPDPVFQSLCTGCGDCRDECPRGLLQKGADGFPVVDFTLGACHFCGECVEACARGALTRSYCGTSWGPWRLKAQISDACIRYLGVACRQCLQHCGRGAIQLHIAETDPRPSIDTQRCNGCGACFDGCPAEAVHLFTDPAS